MAKASISTAWDESKVVMARNPNQLATVALALLILPTTIVGTAAPETFMGVLPTTRSMSLLLLIVMLVGLVGRMTITRIALGPTVTVGGAIVQALRRAPSAVAAFLIFVIPVSLIMTPFLLPVMQTPQSPPPVAQGGLVVTSILALAIGVRLLLMVIPSAVAESGGPFALLKRSWRLTVGNWWRLFAFVLLFFIASTIAGRAVGYAVGAVLILIAGQIESMSLGALILSASLAIVGAAFAVIFAVMLARLYAQLAGASPAEASVPSSGI